MRVDRTIVSLVEKWSAVTFGKRDGRVSIELIVSIVDILTVKSRSVVTLGKKLVRTILSFEERGSRVAFGVGVDRTAASLVDKGPGVTLG